MGIYKRLKILGIATKWVFTLCLPILLLSVSIGWAVNSHWLYNYGFSKYNVSRTTGLADSELEKAASELISYFNSNEEYISLTAVKDGEPFELFNEKEVIHLKDVKSLIWLDYWVLLGTLIYALAYVGVCLLWRKRRYWRWLTRGVVGGGGITLALMLAIGLGTLLGFDRLFYQFHLISFTNELWQLDPTKDYLIMLFPRGFWYDATMFCAGITAGLAIILGGVAGGYLWFSRSKVMS
ncbi:MAG TPA: TIGR01906 family membrane protein [Dehalococcoidia bacterium]|nr:TIGR01906 family membrane protein [Dehalococcoidia bacterium]